MKCLGFWGKEADKPSLSEALITRKVALRKELEERSEKQCKYDSRTTLLKEMRLAHMKPLKKNKLKPKLKTKRNVHKKHSNGSKPRRKTLFIWKKNKKSLSK